MQSLAMWLQCGISSALGCFGWWYSAGEMPKTRLLIALVFGFGGGWLAMFLYAWARYGWRAARSMRMYGND